MLDEVFEDLDWDIEKGLEVVVCDIEGFVLLKVMFIFFKVFKVEYIFIIICWDDFFIIFIFYDYEYVIFEDIFEEIERKLNVYYKGVKIWKMLIFC